ncbi:MAG: TolC family protein [Elusimicrobia bacterium]|nr:TolC family protein [Elusimicrobiota bacterium]
MISTLALLFALGTPSVPGSCASFEKVFSLDEAQRIALQNDARLLSAEQDVIIAQERVNQAKFLFLPEVGLQASATKYEARYPFSLSGDFRNILLFPDNGPFTAGDSAKNGAIYSGRGYMNMALYEGGRTLNTLRLAQAAQKQALSNHESVHMDLQLSVKEVFFRLILAQEKAAATSDFLKSVEEALAKGGLGAWDRVEGESLVGSARARDSEASHNLDLARLNFLKNVNLELDTPFKVVGELETKPVDIDIEKAVLWAVELRPELQSETYKAEMDAITVNIAAGRPKPTVFLASDYELTALRFPLRQNNWDASIGVKLPFSYDFWSQLRGTAASPSSSPPPRARAPACWRECAPGSGSWTSSSRISAR